MSKDIFGDIEWNESHKNFVGLPRPFVKVSKKERIKSKLAAKVPIPWQSGLNNDGNGFLKLIQENEEVVYYKDLCSYCGIKINDKENVIKWTKPNDKPVQLNGDVVFSDIHPFHLECMKQARTYCPGMRKIAEEEFEYGLYSDLKKKSIEERKNIIHYNVSNIMNVLFFIANECQPCEEMKPIVSEINKDRPLTKLRFWLLDSDIEKDLVKKFKIESFPTFIGITGGLEIKRLTGIQTKKTLENFLTFLETGDNEETIQENI
jgi:thiol-disulfide isomerase/thioredoxin